jgi:IS605 OrfB family transposase
MSHRYRLYPTEAQQGIFWQHCGEARFVYNLALEQFNHWSRSSAAKAPSPNQQFRQLTDLREESWLKEGSSWIQQQALRDFHQAKNSWFRGSHGRPTWRKKDKHEGFGIRDSKVRKTSKQWASVHVPKCGWVRFRLSRALSERVGMARVTVNSASQWHVSFNVKPVPIQRVHTGMAIGIDRGVVNTLTTSGEEFLHAPSAPSRQAERFLRLQRQLSRQTLGSQRRQATKLKLGRLRVKEKDRAKDWVEKTTTNLVKENDIIVLEDLRIKQMTKSARGTVAKPGRRVRQKAGLNRAILRQHWGLFAQRLQDKAGLCGVEVIKVPAPHTSDQCRKCDHQDKENRESQAVFRCLECGHREHADVHSAKSILELGMALRGQKPAPAAGLAVTGRGDLAGAGSLKRQPTILASHRQSGNSLDSPGGGGQLDNYIDTGVHFVPCVDGMPRISAPAKAVASQEPPGV